MKQIYSLLSLAVVLGLCLSGCAAPSVRTNLPDYATALTRQMAKQSHMTEGQYDRVRSLNIRQLAEVKRLKKVLADDPELLRRQLQEVKSHYQWELATILWPEQLASLAPYENNLTAQLVSEVN